MRNQKQRSRKGLQNPLEPLDSGNIEIVGGFIEQQEIGLSRHRPCQFGAHPPPAAEGEEWT